MSNPEPSRDLFPDPMESEVPDSQPEEPINDEPLSGQSGATPTSATEADLAASDDQSIGSQTQASLDVGARVVGPNLPAQEATKDLDGGPSTDDLGRAVESPTTEPTSTEAAQPQPTLLRRPTAQHTSLAPSSAPLCNSTPHAAALRSAPGRFASPLVTLRRSRAANTAPPPLTLGTSSQKPRSTSTRRCQHPKRSHIAL